MEGNARKEASQFLAKLGLDAIEMHYAYDQHQRPAQEIVRFALENTVDLLVVGSKGRTNAADLVFALSYHGQSGRLPHFSPQSAV